MKNQNEIEKEVNRIMNSNINKVKIILDRNKDSCFLKEYLEDLIRYGFNSGSLSKEKEMLNKFEKMIDELYNEGQLNYWDLKERLQKLKGDKKC